MLSDAAGFLRRKQIYLLENEELKSHTSFEIGGPAAIFCVPEDLEGLKAAFEAAERFGLPAMVLGRGTNVLFSDRGYEGIIIHLGPGLGKIAFDGSTIHAGAGATLDQVCRAALGAGLTGLEFAYGIPAGLGGAVYMNAGAFGGEMAGVVSSVDYLHANGEVETIAAHRLAFGYRKSIFQGLRGCILSARLSLSPGREEEIRRVMEDHWSQRQQKQPLDMPSAGSAFKRPVGAFAGELIDRCGLRGYRVGNAAISEKHCGFIVNLGGATSSDVLMLADCVARQVKEKTGFSLEKEIRVIEAAGDAKRV